jgi:hypothetical protein
MEFEIKAREEVAEEAKIVCLAGRCCTSAVLGPITVPDHAALQHGGDRPKRFRKGDDKSG